MLACSSGSDGGMAPPEEPPPGGSPIVGLDQRPDNATCLAPPRMGTQASLSVVRVFPALTFDTPIAMLQAPGDDGRWFVVEQEGRVRVFENDPAVTGFETFVDITARVESGGEKGLLGMAFHPDFPSDPRAYLSYTAPGGTLVSRISELRTSDGGRTLDPQSERILLSIDQPQDNHNGGGIAFGPDGYHYIGMGDGGGAGDTGAGHGAIGNGQDLQTLLGKMLRIDVDSSAPGFNYAVPQDNPFVGGPLCGNGGRGPQTCPEIFAYGLRNPWRWSFDRETGALWVGDVGQSALEEIDRVTAGGNFGWRCREGTRTFNTNCGPATQWIDPVAEYERAAGISVTGGYVYRGTSMPALRGRYVFGDFGSGRIWHIDAGASPTLRVTSQDGFASNLSIASFGEGGDGELYLVHHGGTLHRLQQSGPGGEETIPERLSETGCVDPVDPAQPASGLIPYEPAAPFWSDGADKERWIGLPNGERITVGPDGDWEPPNGSVLMQHFRLEGRLIETRLLMRHPDGEWAGYTYEWDEQQTQATRVVGGKQIEAGGQTWIFPSEAQCLLCHSAAAGRALGLETAQLNRDFTYSQTGRTANQVMTLNAIGALNPQVIEPPEELPAMPDPYGSSGPVGERARAWLHTNCSQCHRPGSSSGMNLDLRYSTPLSATGACNVVPQRGDLGIADALIIAPGDAGRSVLVERVGRRDAQAMPPLASAQVDSEGVALLAGWIDGLTSCD